MQGYVPNAARNFPNGEKPGHQGRPFTFHSGSRRHIRSRRGEVGEWRGKVGESLIQVQVVFQHPVINKLFPIMTEGGQSR